MKKIIALILAAMLVLPAMLIHATEYDPANLVINGETFVIPEPEAGEASLGEIFTYQGRIWLPVRVVFNYFGMGVDYDPKDQQIVAAGTNVLVLMQIGSKVMFVANSNGEDLITMDVVPFTREGEGRTYVPAAYLARVLGYDVSWDDATATATFTK